VFRDRPLAAEPFKEPGVQMPGFFISTTRGFGRVVSNQGFWNRQEKVTVWAQFLKFCKIDTELGVLETYKQT